MTDGLFVEELLEVGSLSKEYQTLNEDRDQVSHADNYLMLVMLDELHYIFVLFLQKEVDALDGLRFHLIH